MLLFGLDKPSATIYNRSTEVTVMSIPIVLKADEKYEGFSKPMPCLPNTKYRASVEVTGVKGRRHCAYFGVIVYSKDVEVATRILWLDDFSGKKITHDLIFTTPKFCDQIRIFYRFNTQTPIKAECEYLVQSIETIQLSVDDKESKENFVTLKVPRVRELKPEEELKLEENLVWIFASPRSGTTWLATQLLSYDTLLIDESNVGVYLGAFFIDRVDYTRMYDMFFDQGRHFLSYRYSDTWSYYLRKLILNRIYAQFKDLDHKIILKEPNGSWAADIIAQCLPRSRIIIVVRDGRDTVDSRFYSSVKGSWAHKTFDENENRTAFIQRYAKLWKVIMESCMTAYENHYPDLRLLVKYEELRFNTFDLIKKMYQFIGIPISDDKIAELVEKYSYENIPETQKGDYRRVRKASPGLWKEHFNEEEKVILNEIMGETLSRLGYSE
jgi:hypothetical protein